MSSPFPAVNNSAAPDPPSFFNPNLLHRPLPTNAAWQNYVLKNATQPEYIHPYLVKSNQGSLTICYPTRAVNPSFIFQTFVANLIISCIPTPSGNHTITHYDDLSVTLELPGPMKLPLVRGSPYITCIIKGGQLNFSTIHAVLNVSSSKDSTKHKIEFNNGQTWILYSSSKLRLNPDLSVSGHFEGVLRVALLSTMFSEKTDEKELILDKFSTGYPVSGRVDLSKPYRVSYKWKTKGWGDLLMLSHIVHRQILAFPSAEMVLPQFSYLSMDGELVGVVGDSWILEEAPIPISWYSIQGFQEEVHNLSSVLKEDVANLQPINTTSTYFYGKAIARAARFVLIAEEIHCPDVIPRVRDFLRDSITPWLDGSFQGNGLVYDGKWRGLVSIDGAKDPGGDFGLGVYNDHHYHFGYFCYAIAVLAKLDHSWAHRFKPQVYAIVKDFLTKNPEEEKLYTRLRNFDLWKLHSWAGGLTEFADGRNQESTSEALNAYYSAALLGLAYGDTELIEIGSTLAALEIRSAKAWWHVPLNTTIYEPEFVKENRVMGVLWASKRDSGLWFAPADWRECRLGIQMLPILPITELLFSDVGFAKELVEWTVPALSREGVGEGWKGFVYALESLYDKDGALQKVKTLKGFDDGNSQTNLLWWIYTRGSESMRLLVPEDCQSVRIEQNTPHDFYQQFLSFKKSTQLELQQLAAEVKKLKSHCQFPAQ